MALSDLEKWLLLLKGSFAHGVWFVVEDVDRAASELEEVDVPGEGGLRDKRHSKAELVFEVGNVLGREIGFPFYGKACYGYPTVGGRKDGFTGRTRSDIYRRVGTS